MRKPARFTVLLLLLTAVAGVALAQGTTASLTGTVTSAGNPLPGATVTISSPALQGTRATVSGGSGNYSIQGLPPGDYTVVFEMPGMVTDTQKVRLLLAQTTRADSEMSVSGVAEAVEVKGTAEAVLETTQIATNFTSEEIGRLPVARTIVSTVLLAPGVSNTGVNSQVTISGAPSYDNVFLVNGVVVNENLRGQPHNLFIEDAIQETTILAGGVSAEYGRFTGGVVSTLTKSGGNKFSGSFRDSFIEPGLDGQDPLAGRSRSRGPHRPGLRGHARRPDPEGSPLVLRRGPARGAVHPAVHRDHEPALHERLRRNALGGQAHRPDRERAQLRGDLSRHHQRRDEQRVRERPRLREPRAAPVPPEHASRAQLQRRDHEEPVDRAPVREEGVHVREQRRPLDRPHRRDPPRGHERPPLPRADVLRRLQLRGARQRLVPRQGDVLPRHGEARQPLDRRRRRELRGDAACQQPPGGERLPSDERHVDRRGHDRLSALRVRHADPVPAHILQLGGDRLPDPLRVRERQVGLQPPLQLQPRPSVGQERRQGRRREHRLGRQRVLAAPRNRVRSGGQRPRAVHGVLRSIRREDRRRQRGRRWPGGRKPGEHRVRVRGAGNQPGRHLLGHQHRGVPHFRRSAHPALRVVRLGRRHQQHDRLRLDPGILRRASPNR